MPIPERLEDVSQSVGRTIAHVLRPSSSACVFVFTDGTSICIESELEWDEPALVDGYYDWDLDELLKIGVVTQEEKEAAIQERLREEQIKKLYREESARNDRRRKFEELKREFGETQSERSV